MIGFARSVLTDKATAAGLIELLRQFYYVLKYDVIILQGPCDGSFASSSLHLTFTTVAKSSILCTDLRQMLGRGNTPFVLNAPIADTWKKRQSWKGAAMT